jgi:hypothetical protein
MSYNYHYVKIQVFLIIILTLDCQAIPFQAIPFQVMPSQAMPFHAIPFQVMPSQAMPFQVMPSQAMPFQVMPSQAMPFHANLPSAGKLRQEAFGGIWRRQGGLMRFPETQIAHRPLLSNNPCLRKISYIMRGFSFPLIKLLNFFLTNKILVV